MSANVIDAVYQNGVFKPLQPVTLAENEPVKVLVWVASSSVKTRRRTLFGALQVQNDVSDDDLAWAKQLWERSLDKQMQVVSEHDGS